MRRARSRFLIVVLAIASLPVALSPFGVGAVTIGNQGCTPGYWKNHTSNWEEYVPNQTVGSVFGSGLPQSADSLLTALKYGGGSGVDGARRILLRAAVAATLNAAHDSLGYAWRRFAAPPAPSGFIPIVKSLLAGSNRDAMLAYAGTLDKLNNSGCPLN